MGKESRKKVRISELDFKNIGDRITFIRMMYGKTVEEFSSLLGISKGNLSDLENNKNKPSYDVLTCITKNFNVNSEWVLSGTGKLFKRLDLQDEEKADPGQNQGLLKYKFIQDNLAEKILNEASAIEKISPTALSEIADFISIKLKFLRDFGERRILQRRKVNEPGKAPGGKERRKGTVRRAHDLYRE